MKKLKEIKKETKAKLLTFFGAGYAFLLQSTAVVCADVSEDIANGINGITQVILNIVNPIAILAVVIIGIYCIMAENDTAKSKAKSWLIWIVIGLILINLAEPLVKTIGDIGKQK